MIYVSMWSFGFIIELALSFIRVVIWDLQCDVILFFFPQIVRGC